MDCLRKRVKYKVEDIHFLRIRNWLNQNANWIISAFFTLGLVVFIGLCFDYYYELNDDILMKDIVSGIYTGTPDGHNVYMLWPLGFIISLCYRIVGDFPWYGMFLVGCHYVCVFLILKRSLQFCRTNIGKMIVALMETVLLGFLLLPHFVLIQYTVTSAVLAGTAAFLLLTTQTKDNQSSQEFIIKSIPVILLVILAFLIRYKMLLLVFPLICVAGIIRWGSEKNIFTKEHIIQYCSVFGLIILGLLAGQGAHVMAYGSEEWRTFKVFNDNRTEIYDFQGIPVYEGNEVFYESIGLTESEKILFDNYNFGMDEEIDGKLMGRIAVYAEEMKDEEQPFGDKLQDKFFQYIHRFISGRGVADSDFPWNYVIIIGYFGVLILSLVQKKKRTFWQLPFLFGVRTFLWLYVLMGGRSPERITHSLYFVELCILGVMMLTEGKAIIDAESEKFVKWKGWQILNSIYVCVIILSGLIIGSEQMANLADQTDGRARANSRYQELFEHLSTGDRADNFYLIDVYSWAPIQERVFLFKDNSLVNYDIMGGWICKSPLQSKKWGNFGIDNIEQALSDYDNVYFIKQTSADMDWLKTYYVGHGTPVEIHLVETVTDRFEIYMVKVDN